jgi:hypothetical protein
MILAHSPSGEGTRLSTEREGFDLPMGRAGGSETRQRARTQLLLVDRRQHREARQQ